MERPWIWRYLREAWLASTSAPQPSCLTGLVVPSSTDEEVASSWAADEASGFCPGEPLRLEDAGELLGGGLTYGSTPCPFSASPLQMLLFSCPPAEDTEAEATTVVTTLATSWPVLSPWKDGKLDHMVHNTFIHEAPLPPTPVPGAIRRSSSMVDLADCSRCGEPSGSSTPMLHGSAALYSSTEASPAGKSQAGSPRVTRFCPDEPLIRRGSGAASRDVWQGGYRRVDPSASVLNTFIHAGLAPPTPVIGTLRRSSSMPKELRCCSPCAPRRSFASFASFASPPPIYGESPDGAGLDSSLVVVPPQAGQTLPPHLLGVARPGCGAPRVLCLVDHLMAN